MDNMKNTQSILDHKKKRRRPKLNQITRKGKHQRTNTTMKAEVTWTSTEPITNTRTLNIQQNRLEYNERLNQPISIGRYTTSP